MKVFYCENSFYGILTCIYDAWDSGYGHANVKLIIGEPVEYELFCKYIKVYINEEKAEKVIRSIKSKLSNDIYKIVFKTSLSKLENRADIMYRFLIDAFKYGNKITHMLTLNTRMETFEICRAIDLEAHLHLGFIRFNKNKTGILISKITPKNDVLSIVALHFADRLSSENWIIYDYNRKVAVVHKVAEKWFKVKLEDETVVQLEEVFLAPNITDGLWKIFFENINIKERYNPVCQRGHLPIRYRQNMTEFIK